MSNSEKKFHFSRERNAKRKAAREEEAALLSSQSRPGSKHPKLAIINGNLVNNCSKMSSISDAYLSSKISFADLEAVGISNEAKLFKTLTDTFEFFRIGTIDDESRLIYNGILKEAGIKITRNTTNPFVPAIKAIFGPADKTTRGRYAAALYLAHAEGENPDQLEHFIKEKGGLVACARDGSARIKPDRATEKTKREKDDIAALRKAGKILKLPHLSKELQNGFSVALFSKDNDGTLTFLAHRVVELQAASRFKPLF